MFDKKKNIVLVKLIIIILSLILISVLIEKILAKFESTANSSADIQAAFYLINDDYQSMTINLATMEPRNSEYSYTFSISNNDGTKRTETVLDYDLIITTTTNLPLGYKLYINGGTTNIFNDSQTIIDEYGTYFRKYTTATRTFGITQDETNVYTLKVEFPATYKQNETYQDIIESIEFAVKSKQKIS